MEVLSSCPSLFLPLSTFFPNPLAEHELTLDHVGRQDTLKPSEIDMNALERKLTKEMER
jgi:hypothetical protein